MSLPASSLTGTRCSLVAAIGQAFEIHLTESRSISLEPGRSSALPSISRFTTSLTMGLRKDFNAVAPLKEGTPQSRLEEATRWFNSWTAPLVSASE